MRKPATPRPPAERRSYTMSRIRGKDTSIEVALRKALWREGIRYRKNYRLLPRSPDIAITKYRIAIFCDGEFWHGKDWAEKITRLKDNREYWIAKIERNIQRDNEIDRQLQNRGWCVLRFWGDDIRKNLMDCVDCVKEAIFQTRLDAYSNHDADDRPSERNE